MDENDISFREKCKQSNGTDSEIFLNLFSAAKGRKLLCNFNLKLFEFSNFIRLRGQEDVMVPI